MERTATRPPILELQLMGITFLINEERCSYVVSIRAVDTAYKKGIIKGGEGGARNMSDAAPCDRSDSGGAKIVIATTYHHQRRSETCVDYTQLCLHSHLSRPPFASLFSRFFTPLQGASTILTRAGEFIIARSGQEVQALSSNLFWRIDLTPS